MDEDFDGIAWTFRFCGGLAAFTLSVHVAQVGSGWIFPASFVLAGWGVERAIEWLDDRN